MLELLTNPAVWASFLSLAMLEIILGVDNVVFISIAASKLPEEERRTARIVGLSIGLFLRVALLFSIVWIASLTAPVFDLFGVDFSWRDVILAGGGAFLVWKSVSHICQEMESYTKKQQSKPRAKFWSVIAQITVLDVVFSLDSVITAVGIADHTEVMVAAIIVAVIMMMVAAGPISHFVERHPSTKMLCLAFLLFIGIALIADGLHHHIDRAFIYGVIIFAGLVEVLNLVRAKKSGKPAEPSDRQAG